MPGAVAEPAVLHPEALCGRNEEGAVEISAVAALFDAPNLQQQWFEYVRWERPEMPDMSS